MVYIQVYFDGELDHEFALRDKVTTIGRGADCDIIIANSGISELHARIRMQGDAILIEDARSTNGIYVNGERVQSQYLQYGDEITVLKHQLRLVAEPVGTSSLRPNSPATEALSLDETTELDVAMLNEALAQLERNTEAFLQLAGVQGMRRQYPLKKVNFKIGKSRNCDMYTEGWFAPELAARIQRRADGYYLEPRPGGKVRVNGMPSAGETKLEDGDGLVVRHLAMTFHEENHA